MFLKKLSLFCIYRYKNRQTSFTLYSKYTSLSINYFANRHLSTDYQESIYNNILDDQFEIYGHESPVPVRFSLYKCSDDALINQLYKTVSIQETLDVVEKYSRILNYKHLTQTVLVLWDLQQIYIHVTKLSNVDHIDRLITQYISQLTSRKEFIKLLELITKNANEFAFEELCSTLFYLNKIGLPLQDPNLNVLMKNISKRLTHGEFSLTGVSKYLLTIRNNSSYSYLHFKDYIPEIYKNIENCKNVEDLKLLTICFNAISNVILKDIKIVYEKKVEELIINNILSDENYAVILRVIKFLSNPLWRHESIHLINRCILLLRGNLNKLNIYETLLLLEIFSKNSEPADILTELQRCSYKYFYNLEENTNKQLNLKIRLLAHLIKFSSGEQKSHFNKLTNSLLSQSLDGLNLLDLNKTLKSTRNIEVFASKRYWSTLLENMEHDEHFKNKNILKICLNYLNYFINVNYRNVKFEKRINQWLEGEIEDGFTNIIPRRFFVLASFVIAFGSDVSVINHVVNKLKCDWEQLQHIDCLNLSKALGVASLQNKRLNERYTESLNYTLNKSVILHVKKGVKTTEISALLKSYIYRSQYDENQITYLLNSFKDIKENINSMYIKNMTFALLHFNALVPCIMDSMINYVIHNKSNILAWNAERVAYLCFHLGYLPDNHKQFLNNLVDLMVRDRERLSGLSLINCCIALCHFGSASTPLIKQIFNTEFLEKLELEFLNYPLKDAYPRLVRQKLMELNRMICIDYPELHIPWFHQKYNEELNFAGNKTKDWDLKQVTEFLEQIYKCANISTDVSSPYGYLVDCVVELADSIKPTKLALIILKPNAFTKVNVQLTGYMQLKIRHLEILGFVVILLDFSKWKSLLCGTEKLNYLKEICSNYDNKLKHVNR